MMKKDATFSQLEPDADGCRILAVEDDPAVRRLLELVLTEAGYSVSLAEDAQGALEHAQDLSLRIAIVDVNLPGLSGLELCRRLSSEFGLDVLLITGDQTRYNYETATKFGAVDFLVKPLRTRDLQLRLQHALANRRIRKERDALISELRKLSVTDDLTGLFNARHLFTQLRSEIGRATRYGKSFSLLIMDLDNFKSVNDRFGHLRGDETLKRVADILTDSIRDVDTAFRYGGEEMAVILPETDAESVGTVARRILDNTRFEIIGDDGKPAFAVSVSIGITDWHCGESFERLMQRADQAMYAAKAKGRNRIEMSLWTGTKNVEESSLDDSDHLAKACEEFGPGVKK